MDLGEMAKDILKTAFDNDKKILEIMTNSLAEQITLVLVILHNKGIVTEDEIQKYQETVRQELSKGEKNNESN